MTLFEFNVNKNTTKLLNNSSFISLIDLQSVNVVCLIIQIFSLE